MLMQFVADVHGAHEKYKDKLDPDLPVCLLGDNLNLVDFYTLSGVATEVLTKFDISKILLSIATGGPKKAKKIANKIFFNNPQRVEKARKVVAREYEELRKSISKMSFVIHGNVDYPDLLSEALGSSYIDVGVKEFAGVKVGFLSGTGSYAYSLGLPGEISNEEYKEKLWSLGKVDILCTHFPPAIEDLTYDVVAKRSEGGGEMINEYILEMKPKLHLFGHIHNPKVHESTLGETKLKNVGGFRYHGQVHTIDIEKL